MAKANKVIQSLNAGELSPLLEGRIDQEKYQMGCRTLENFYPLIYGGVERRPGTEFIASQKTQSAKGRVVGFEHSVDDCYVLCFENQVIRVFKNGEIVNGGGNGGTDNLTALDTANSLIAHWKLNEVDGGSVVVDEETTHNGTSYTSLDTTTVPNSTLTKAGVVGACFDLDGQYCVRVDDAADLSFTDNTNDSALSIIGWAYITTTGSMQVILSKWGTGSASSEWRLALDANNKLQLTLNDSSSGLSTSTIAQWKLNDDTTNNTVTDSIAGTYNGTSSTAHTDDISDDNGKIDKCFNFAGTKYVTIADANGLSFDDSSDKPMSIAAWVYYESAASTQDILTKEADSTHAEYDFQITSSGLLRMVLNKEGSSSVYILRTANVPLSVGWHLVCMTYENDNAAWTKETAADYITLYVDGSAVAATSTNSASYTKMSNTTANCVIGGYGTTPTFKNKIDNVILFNKTLSISDITKLWNNGLGTENLTGEEISATSDDAIPAGWNFIGATYSAPADEATAANGIILYNNAVALTSTKVNNANYGAMQGGALKVVIGAQRNSANDGNEKFFADKIDEVAIFSRAITPTEISSLLTSSPLEITTPYLTADIPYLDIKQSADVMFISHDDYESRRLSRLSDTNWTLEVENILDGPFNDENTDTAKTITPSGSTGTITLTATGHTPFVAGTVAGHSPSGAEETSKSQTGALFRLVHALLVPSVSASLAANSTTSVTSTLEVSQGVTWDFTTNGTWGGDDGATVILQRSYDSGTTYEIVATITSANNDNIVTSGTEEVADAIYRAKVSEAGSTGTVGTCQVQLSVRDSSHIGVVKILSVTSPTVATGLVVKALGDSTATHRWSEGSWSNYRGWPRTVEISPEERLTYSGSISKPLTSWGSVSGDYTSFKEGTLDDSAIIFTLIGSSQQNIIQWAVPKDSLMFGTVGGELLLGASNKDEALSPTNVQARVKGTRGSEHLKALLVNDTILFLQRGGRKVRELSNTDTYDSTIYKADDLTVFSNHITESGVVDWAYQRSPDPMLWCIRDDGQIAVMMYEKQQDVYSWSRVVLSGTNAKAESIAIIYGGTNSEDEVWITVSRTVNGATIRNIERFKPREWGSTLHDAFFVDSGTTYDSTPTSSITGLTHLIGETVQVFADGVKFDDAIVNGSGVITLKLATVTTNASVVQVGLGYTSTCKPMKLDLQGMGLTVTKKITEGVLQLYKTIGGQWGNTTSNMFAFGHRSADIFTDTTLFTGAITVPFNGGYDISGDIILRQTDPYPMTILSLSLDLGAHSF